MIFFKKLLFKIQHKLIYRKNKRPDEIINDFFKDKKFKFIVQVGGNDGVQNDPLRKYFKYKSKYRYKAIIFEPIKYYYLKLNKLYKKNRNISIKKNFISNTKKNKKIFYLKPNMAKFLNLGKIKNDWAHGLGSLKKKNVISAIEKNDFRGIKYKKKIPEFKKLIISEKVKPFKISEINFPKNFINLLVIDVQGHEINVIKSINFKKKKIDYIYYEDENKLSNESNKIKKILKKNNYKLISRLSWVNLCYYKKFPIKYKTS